MNNSRLNKHNLLKTENAVNKAQFSIVVFPDASKPYIAIVNEDSVITYL